MSKLNKNLMGDRELTVGRLDSPCSRSVLPLIRVAAVVATFLVLGNDAMAGGDAEPPRSTSAITAPPASPAAVTSKLTRYAERIVERYDIDGDGLLSADEWKVMQGQPDVADANQDGRLTVEEFARHVAAYGSGRRIRLSSATTAAENPPGAGTSEAAAKQADTLAMPEVGESRRETKYVAPIASGAPGWFIERDSDGDGQLTLSEFSPRLRAPEVTEFNRYDLNGDGLLTPAELARATSKAAAGPAAPATAP